MASSVRIPRSLAERILFCPSRLSSTAQPAPRSFIGSALSCNQLKPNSLLNRPSPDSRHAGRKSLHTTSLRSAVAQPRQKEDLRTKDRGPTSKEDTQTDFGEMNVLGSTANPSTSVDICNFDGFMLDSGLVIAEGDGVILTGSEAFVWRPWMGLMPGSGAEAGTRAGGEGGGRVNSDGSVRNAGATGRGAGRRGGAVVNGAAMSRMGSEIERTGGVLNAMGQFEIPDGAWGVFDLLWPKPDLLILGTGPSIRPLAPSTRTRLQNMGLRIEVLDTRNAASQFNLLATERGVQEVAAALVPIGFGLKTSEGGSSSAYAATRGLRSGTGSTRSNLGGTV